MNSCAVLSVALFGAKSLVTNNTIPGLSDGRHVRIRRNNFKVENKELSV